MRFVIGLVVSFAAFYVLLNLATAGIVSWPWFILYIFLDVTTNRLMRTEK